MIEIFSQHIHSISNEHMLHKKYAPANMEGNKRTYVVLFNGIKSLSITILEVTPREIRLMIKRVGCRIAGKLTGQIVARLLTVRFQAYIHINVTIFHYLIHMEISNN